MSRLPKQVWLEVWSRKYQRKRTYHRGRFAFEGVYMSGVRKGVVDFAYLDLLRQSSRRRRLCVRQGYSVSSLTRRQTVLKWCLEARCGMAPRWRWLMREREPGLKERPINGSGTGGRIVLFQGRSRKSRLVWVQRTVKREARAFRRMMQSRWRHRLPSDFSLTSAALK